MPPDDLYHDMRRYPIDDHTAERLLAGAVEPDDAPPGYAKVSSLIQAAKMPVIAGELDRRDSDISAIAAVVAAAATAPDTAEGTRMISKRLGMKALAIAIPALALTATGAAAATGNLPAPAQSAVHGALADVGLSVPNSGNTGTHAANNANAVGPDATGPAKFGLCRAYLANKGRMSTNSVAFRNLEKAAAGSTSVASYCTGVTPGNGTASDSAVNGAADSNGTSSSVSTGKPSTTPGSNHPSTSTPEGPPSSTPGSDHPSGSTPGSDHPSTSTPAGPPSSTPAGKR